MRSKRAYTHHRHPRIQENTPAHRNGQLAWTALVAISLAAAALHHVATSSRPLTLAHGAPERVTNRTLSYSQSMSSVRPGELPARRLSYPH